MKFPEADRKTKRVLRSNIPYQRDRLDAAVPFLRGRGLALDIGAHIGMWTAHLVRVFDRVIAFEPHRETFEALKQNFGDHAKVVAHNCALGDVEAYHQIDGVGLGAHLAERVNIDHQSDIDWDVVPVKRLDDFMPARVVDFIKIDVEGFEPFVVIGGEQTIRASRPVIVIEQKHARYGHEKDAAVTMLQSWGAKVEWRMKNDYCLRW